MYSSRRVSTADDPPRVSSPPRYGAVPWNKRAIEPAAVPMIGERALDSQVRRRDLSRTHGRPGRVAYTPAMDWGSGCVGSDFAPGAGWPGASKRRRGDRSLMPV
jgi:hypothetical protein